MNTSSSPLESERVNWLLLAGIFLLGAVAWPFLPAQVPIHWSPSGEIDRHASRLVGVLALPLIALGLYTVLWFLPRLDPDQENRLRTSAAVSKVSQLVLWLFLFVQALVLTNGLGLGLSLGSVGASLLAVLFIGLGLYLPRLPRNGVVGVRTPWTQTSELAWAKTNLLGGWLMVATGVLLLGTGLLAPTWILRVLIAACLVDIAVVLAYSYRVWRGSQRSETA